MVLGLTLPFRLIDGFAPRIIAMGTGAILSLLTLCIFLHTIVLERAAQRGASDIAAMRLLPVLNVLSDIDVDRREATARMLSTPDFIVEYAARPLVQRAGQQIDVGPGLDWDGGTQAVRAEVATTPSSSGAVQEVRLSVELSANSWLNARVHVVSLLPADDLTFRVASISAGGILLLLAWFASRSIARPLSALAERTRSFPADGVLSISGLGGPREVREVAEALQAATARTQELLRQRSFALAALSHDLLSPLTRLRLRLEDLPDGQLRRRTLHDISEMNDMVRDVLAYLRGLEGDTEAKVAVSVGSIVQVIVDEMAEEGHVIEERIVEDPIIVAQPIALRRAIRNLASNAIKYGRDAWIEVRRASDSVTIEVGNRGSGLTQADLARVFEPFFRSDQARAAGEGSGLGLPTALAIAEAHGGTLRLSSSESQGTIAVLKLPAQSACPQLSREAR